MVSFNRVVLAGNLTRDPELRFTQEVVLVLPHFGGRFSIKPRQHLLV
jgi:hypothetical protein